jgi:hypothetical protein
MKSIKIRLTSGIRKSTLIINFPGSAKACGECLVIIEPVLQHAIDQLRDNTENITLTHNIVQGFQESNANEVLIMSIFFNLISYNT